MPNLVGTGNNQVPTNAMLGGLAFQDTDHAVLKQVEIDKIAAIKSHIKTQGHGGGGVIGDSTISDVFVYDTRTDSDGGAWRKRTQSCSWYNEPLNTDYRGSRREFPSIAILVAHAGSGFYGFTIHDGDDPTLPMWMRFHIPSYTTASDWGSGIPMIGRVHFVTYSSGPICAMNGQISLGNINNNEWQPGWMVNMISEKCLDLANYGNGTANQCYWMSSNIADRVNFNSYTVFTWDQPRGLGGGEDHHNHLKSGITGKINNGEIRSIRMAVTPDALIDQDTGLPVPTQAWAGKKGISVMKGSSNSWVTSQSSSHTEERAEFNSQFDIHTISRHGSAPNCVQMLRLEYPNYSSIGGGNYYHSNRSCALDASMGVVFSGYEDLKFMKNPYGGVDDLAVIPSSNQGLNLYLGDGNDGTATNKSTICARITTDYNTGWMMGACDIAMADTSATNITAAVHQYSDFSSAGGWGSGANGSTISGGNANLVNQGNSRIWHTTYLVANTYYCCEYKVAGNVDDWVFDDDGAGSGQTGGSTTIYHANTNTANGTFWFVFKSTASTRLRLMRNGTTSSTTINIDYIRIHKINQDSHGVAGCQNRSITNGHNYGFATVGTLVRNSVSRTASSTDPSGGDAIASDTVAYSSFGTNNYLIRGYSSDFDIGTNDFLCMGWVWPSESDNASQVICGVGDWDQNNGFIVQLYGGSEWKFDVGYLGVTNSFSSSNGGTAVISRCNLNRWNMFAAYKKGSNFRMFVNGQFTGAWGSSSVNWTTKWHTPHMRIGGRPGVGHTHQSLAPNTRLAMIRWGEANGSWDDDLFRQVYEDEKQLFRPGAKAVLTGGLGQTWTVKDIDYDTRTDTLHAASQYGTSEFKRLVRINSTSSSTSIVSAQGGIVGEVP